VGAVVLLVLSAIWERDAVWQLTWRGAACLAYLACFGTVLAFTLYFWALRHVRATRLALMSYVTPVIALTLGAVVGDEPVGAWTVAGLGLILAGVTLSLRRSRTEARTRSEAGETGAGRLYTTLGAPDPGDADRP
jgi:drug/metabolite transporter (DMT)-like permease